MDTPAPYIGRRPHSGDTALVRTVVTRELLGDATPSDIGPAVEDLLPAPYALTLIAFVPPSEDAHPLQVQGTQTIEVRACGFTRPADGSSEEPFQVLSDALIQALVGLHHARAE